MIRRPTHSALPRALECRASNVLPRVSSRSSAAAAGTARHRFFERIAEVLQHHLAHPEVQPATVLEARAVALDEAPPDLRPVLALIPLETLQLENVAHEVAVALNVVDGSARELGRGLGRAYPTLSPDWCVGTIDRLAIIDDQTLYIGDYKGAFSRRRAKDDPQLLANALTACRIYGRPRAKLEILRVGDGEVWFDSAEISAAELDLFELRLQDLWQTIDADAAEGEVEATTGEWCDYCPSFAYCPAKAALARAVIGGDHAELRRLAAEGLPLLSMENAPRIRVLLTEAKQVLDRVEDAIKLFARQTPIPLPDGRVYGVPPGRLDRKIADVDRAQEILATTLSPAIAGKAIKRELSLGAVEDAVRSWLAARPGTVTKRGELSKKLEDVEAQLKAAGALTERPSTIVTSYRPKAEEQKP